MGWPWAARGGGAYPEKTKHTQSPWQPLRGFTDYGITCIVFHIIFPQQKLTGDPWEGPDVPEELFLS